MIRAASMFALLLAGAACREVREDPSPAQESDGTVDAALEAAQADRADASADDARVASPEDAAAPAAWDAAPTTRDAAGAGSEAGAQPSVTKDASVDAATRPDASDAASGDSGTSVVSCVSLPLNNIQGVGKVCSHSARELACPVTQTCTEGVELGGPSVPAPHYCTKSCAQHSDCGDEARCCKPAGAASKICIVKGCWGSCQ